VSAARTDDPPHQRLDITLSFGNTLKIMEVSEEPQGYSEITIVFDRFIIKAKGDVMYTLPVDKLVNMKVAYVDAGGNPATVDGAVSWQSSDDNIVTVAVDSGDSTMCRVTPVGATGQVQVTATADADLGTGVRQLITVCDITVVAGEAVAGTIEPVGEPQPIAPHVEPRR
jgi:hypothetical protein